MSLISSWRTPAVTLGFSSKRTKSAPLLFLYAFLKSSFACIYCHRRKNVLNMGEGARLRLLRAKGWAGNRLAGWKPFKHPLLPDRYKKIEFCEFCEPMSC